ncbi:sensor histidine kinase [Williamsia sterculiae]|nr:sensor histidine kinase [Williamsia sterculiae]
MTIWLPLGLLIGSMVCTVLAGLIGSLRSVVLMIALMVAAGAVHVVTARMAPLARGPRVTVYLVQLVVATGLIVISPFFGIYAFMGYVAALLAFEGPVLYAALALNAVVVAVAQVGGAHQVAATPGAFIALFVVNIGVVAVLGLLSARREREMIERERTLDELEAAQRRNADLQTELLGRATEQGKLTERARLSREIHDTVAQDLVAIVSQLEAIGPGVDWQQRVDTAKRLARDGLAEARRAVAALRSPMLDDQSLPTALTDMVAAWSTVHDIAARSHVDGSPVPTGDDQNLLRICQEALSNVARHARASAVEVTLTYTEEGVLLDVRDDGCGFDASLVHRGNGLGNMQERVRPSGGSVEWETSVGSGCLVRTVVPA